ncbi:MULTISPECIES: SMI1/KNR4 family protein [Pseudoalteromonas]|uniref:SMI1/KNR4 family protein n=1 Tax=Pseudoalteromonas maricaloris TaxID=184924 RepID=A0A8I2HAZ5_9GAMM|nr:MULTISPECIES: SMI1/KNR4 family protein [Pseudoalteromonas]KID38872.1 hypothetical protein QT15_02905 [Pseudoalteromonas flavipulchra NCIMB 2033 = ATCC BAA-314]MBD0783639.1 SMI1/KNR4 family protein [Pseudoalteromonas flavipulchra]MBE0375039.1 hypothetical protein [Pseudoalteromonas flavipulchra NCIMB 2033 = ATCC BAA-314]MBR8841280.1 SMI1/KNR4 family protein [Pseudoalteromonas sp. JC3]NLR24359.1 SMI1/KNR4 family protein [Pseudoalteromonas maricaloris]
MKNFTHDELKQRLESLNEFEYQGSHSDLEIKEAESVLNLRLPESFKDYLKAWGNIAIGPIEILGLTKTPNFINAEYPNFVWFTLKKRSNDQLPKELVVFHSVNNEFLYCINCSKPLSNGECVITVWNNLDKIVEQEYHVGFNNFILGILEDE